MASISTLTKQGKVIGFQSNLGRDGNGKERRKFHKTYEEAQSYIKSEESENHGTGEIFRQKAEIVFALQRLGICY